MAVDQEKLQISVLFMMSAVLLGAGSIFISKINHLIGLSLTIIGFVFFIVSAIKLGQSSKKK
jgi:hypothetical protein